MPRSQDRVPTDCDRRSAVPDVTGTPRARTLGTRVAARPHSLHAPAAVLSALALIALTGCGNNLDGQGASAASEATDCQDGPLQLGVVLEVTGFAASIGGAERDAAELAVAQINADGGVNGEPVEVTILDNQSREDQAAKHATQLVNEDAVHVLIGSGRSAGAVAMRPIAERGRTPMIALGASAKIIEGSEYVYKTPPSDSVVVEQLVQHLSDQGHQEVGLLRDSSAFGEGVAELIDEAGADLGVTVSVVEKFDPAATEFTAQVLNVKNADTDANIVWGSSTSGALAVKAYRELGVAPPLFASYGVAAPTLIETAGAEADGLVLNGNKVLVAGDLPADDPQKEALSSFVTAYEDEYGTTPSPFAGYAWDAVRLAAEAAEAGGTCRSGILTALDEIEAHVGVTGVYDFTTGDHSGLSESPLVFLEVRNGEFEVLGES